MQAEFWHQRWSKGEIGFHESDINPLLLRHFKQLDIRPTQRVFVPLCGKTLDIGWLLQQGYQVLGAELSELAIKALFASLNIQPKISSLHGFARYQGPNIDILVGDIFDLNAQLVGQIDAIYDRAALVALPSPMRAQYSQQLLRLSDGAPQLLICFDYAQEAMAGPPFAVKAEEIKQLYGQHYALELLSSEPLQGGLKGKIAALQQTWLLSKQ